MRKLFLLLFIMFLGLSCQFDSSGIDEYVESICGNYIIEDGEECDGAKISASCSDFGYDSGDLFCTSDCHIDSSGCFDSKLCGNGIIDPGEECDGTNLNNENCISLNYYGGVLQCNSNCKFDLNDCMNVGRCGDGFLQADEECDSTNFGELNCSDFNFYAGVLKCSSECHMDISECYNIPPNCGDGILQISEGEVCDGTDFGDETCNTQGFFGGVLGCSPDCTAFDISNCGEYMLYGTTLGDYFADIKFHNGFFFITGYTFGQFTSQVHWGEQDAFLLKISDSGIIQYAKQFGSSKNEVATGIIYDSGYVYVSGYSNGTYGTTYQNETYGVFVSKFSEDGTNENVFNIDTPYNDYAYDIASNGSFLYLAGSSDGDIDNNGYTGISQDAFIMKMSFDGTVLWVKQFGSTLPDEAKAITVCSNDFVYLAGSTEGSIDGTSLNQGAKDIFVAKFTSDGTLLWINQYGSLRGEEIITAKCDSNGDLMVGGFTTGNLFDGINAGEQDLFFMKLDEMGNRVFFTQLGSTGSERVTDIEFDTSSTYIVGYTTGSLGSNITAGNKDGFIINIDNNGNINFIHQLGTDEEDVLKNILIGSGSRLYISGYTRGQPPDTISIGEMDVFIGIIR